MKVNERIIRSYVSDKLGLDMNFDWDEVRQRVRLIYVHEGEVQCQCSHTPIRHNYYLKDIHSNTVLGPIGSRCINARFGWGDAVKWVKKGLEKTITGNAVTPFVPEGVTWGDVFNNHRSYLEWLDNHEPAWGWRGERRKLLSWFKDLDHLIMIGEFHFDV